MPAVAEQSQEAKLKSQIAELKQRVSDSENARNLLSRDLAAAQKKASKSGDLEAQVATLETLVGDRDKQISRLQADVASARAKAAEAEVILDAARAMKRLVDLA